MRRFGYTCLWLFSYSIGCTGTSTNVAANLNLNITPSPLSEWAVHQNAVFRAVDLVAFVRNVVLRIVGQSMAMQRLGGRFPPVRRWEGDMVQLRVVPLCEAKVSLKEDVNDSARVF